jgi:3-hydroxyacyl-[acyl-carrier-protein] dehydratase
VKKSVEVDGSNNRILHQSISFSFANLILGIVLMASLAGFYSVISDATTENTATVVVSINPKHEVYEGHFPKQPVAPGAALMQMVIDEASRLFANERIFVGAKQVKFLSVLNPNKTTILTMEYTFVERDALLQFACTGKNDETIFFKINGTFR